MKLKKILLEIGNSGIILVAGGGGMINIESSLSDPSLVWLLIGLGWVILGISFGTAYMEKEARNYTEKR